VSADEIILSIRSDVDIVSARQKVRETAMDIGFTGSDLTVIATAISELARNILTYARVGEIVIRPIHQSPRKGIEIIARDEGSGIPDIDQAMRDGYSTSQGLGLGLPGTRRLMDEFEIVSVVGEGTTVTIKKWLE
jgi:serine/threonine-protein kinase RsbT